MNNYHFFFAIIIVFILYVGIQKSIEDSSHNYVNYTNYNNGFTLKHPTDWLINDMEYTCSDFPSTKNVITLSSEEYGDKNTNNKILLFIENLKKNASNFMLNEYAIGRLNFYKNFGNIIQFDTNSKLGNETAYTVVLEYNPNTSSIDRNTNSSSTIIGEIGTLLDSKIYRIIYILEKIQNDNFQPILDQIINSFTTINITDNQKNNETPFSWNSYSLKNGNNKYSINYDMKGLGNRLLEIKPLIGQAALLFNVHAPNDGSLLVEIPRKLLDSKLQNDTDYKFHITNDNKPNTPYEEIKSDSNDRILKIEIDDEDRIILIEGSQIDIGTSHVIKCSNIIFPIITITDNKTEENTVNEITNKFEGFKSIVPLKLEGKNYTIDINSTTKNITIKNLEMLNVDTLLMDIDSSSTGMLEVTVPRKLLDAKENGQDVPFNAIDNTVDRAFFPEEVKTTSQDRTLSIPFSNETTFIMIMSLN
jgi:hypothetical protein